MSYGQMAQVYDLLMEDAPYGKWVEFTKKMVHRFKPDAHTMLDVGCGTGEITHRLQQEGFQMTGIDLSSDMLTVAQQKDPRSNIKWMHQDMTALEGMKGYDCVISYCDVFNYLMEDHQVQRAFDNIYHSLDTGGLFMFDVHSLDHIQEDLSGATFAEVRDDLSYIWFCDQGEKLNSVVHDLTFFVQNGKSFQRFDEVHEQRGYERKVLECWLNQTGFELLGLYSDFSEKPSSDGERWLFICRK